MPRYAKQSLAARIEALTLSFSLALAETMRTAPLDELAALGRSTVGGNRIPKGKRRGRPPGSKNKPKAR